MFQGCFKGVLRVFVSRKFKGSLKGVSRKFQGCFKEVSRMFQGNFMEVLREFQKSFLVVSVMSLLMIERQTCRQRYR